MKIEEGQLVLPPVSARPDGFDLFYQRRSLRKTYQYEMDGEQFSLTVCKDQAHTLDTDETVVKSFDETPAMVLFYYWNQVKNGGNEHGRVAILGPGLRTWNLESRA